MQLNNEQTYFAGKQQYEKKVNFVCCSHQVSSFVGNFE